MTRNARIIKSILALTLVTSLAAPAAAPARDAKEMPEGRKSVAVGEWAFRRLNRAQDALAAERYDDCIEQLAEMQKNERRLNEYEKALLWQMYGYVHSSKEEYEKAAESFQKSLDLGGLPEQSQLSTQYNLAQLYVMLERYGEAIPLFLDWFDRTEKPPASAFYMLAVAYVQGGDQAKALPYAKESVLRAGEPKESWLQLLLSLYLESKAYADASGVLGQLVERFPKKLYWMQLSAVSTELGDHKKALAALELAYTQGVLDEGKELMNLAVLYLYNEIPYKAAKVLEEGIANGTIEPDAEAWAWLANSWLYARERDKAVEPLQKAAELSGEGDLYVRLAQVRMEQEEWADAVSALDKALQKGKLKDKDKGNAYLMLGIANANARRWEASRRAFESARDFDQTEKAASQWLVHLETEKSLDETLTSQGSQQSQGRS